MNLTPKDLTRAKQLTALSSPSERSRLTPTASWYRISNLADDETEVLIYDEIGWYGVSADDFVRELNDITTSKIRLRVNSPGGSVFDGIAIYNAIVTHPATVTAVVDGLAASAASFIICAAETTEIHRNAQLMIHDARGICVGNANDMQEMLDLLNLASDNIADIYQQKAGGTVAEWRAVMQEKGGAGRWYSAAEALEAGLVDTVLSKAGKNEDDPEPAEQEPAEDEDDLEDLLQGLDLAGIMNTAFGK